MGIWALAGPLNLIPETLGFWGSLGPLQLCGCPQDLRVQAGSVGHLWVSGCWWGAGCSKTPPPSPVPPPPRTCVGRPRATPWAWPTWAPPATPSAAAPSWRTTGCSPPSRPPTSSVSTGEGGGTHTKAGPPSPAKPPRGVLTAPSLRRAHFQHASRRLATLRGAQRPRGLLAPRHGPGHVLGAPRRDVVPVQRPLHHRFPG